MWTPRHSAKLSLILTDIIFLIAVIAGIFLPLITSRYIELTGKSQSLRTVLITVCYCCLPFAAAALLTLRRLLKNILKSKAFIGENVRLLRILSWCCTAYNAYKRIFLSALLHCGNGCRLYRAYSAGHKKYILHGDRA